jgi:nucleoside-triphosphatase THEP1
LTPALVRDGVKVGIQAVDLCSGEARPLARSDRDLGGVRVGRYAFDDRTLHWMRSLCEGALASDALVFVDEIGPLELDRGRGLASLIPSLSRPREGHTVVIVRDTLLEELRTRTRRAGPRVVALDAERRDMARREMRVLLFPGEESG